VPCNASPARALTLGVSRGVLTGRSDPLPMPCHALACLVGTATKERQDGCLFPITLPVTDGLGENAAGALNALVPMPASGGVRRPCARGLPIRTSLSPYSTVAGARALGDSQDALSVFVATVVEDRAYNWASSWRPRLSYGCSRYAHRLGYPLLISSTVALEPPFERLRSNGGSFLWTSFRGGTRATPRGSPRALEGVFDSFEGCIA